MRRTILLLCFCPLLANADPLTIWTNNVQNPSCMGATGAIDIMAQGGVGPYTYVWSNSATTEDISGLVAGYYEVTVTDAMSTQVTEGWTLVATSLTSPESAQDGHASCIGQLIGGEVRVYEPAINGTPPYTYSPQPIGIDGGGSPYFDFPTAPLYTQVFINVTDANGCTGVLQETITGPQPVGGPFMQLQAVQGSCSGGSGGSATITNIYDGVFFSGPEVYLYNPLDQESSYGISFSNVIFFDGLAPGHYHIRRDWDPQGYIMANPCPPDDTLGFDIPDLGVACGTVSGNVFIDNNDNCAHDAGEVNVPQEVLEITPGPMYTITDAAGHYSIDLADGNYSLAQNDATLVQLCPTSTPVPFTLSGNAQVIALADSSTVPLDLRVMLSNSHAVPGFGMTFYFDVENHSAQISAPVTVQLTFDPTLVYSSATPTPTSVIGTTITWDLPALTAFAQEGGTISFDVPGGTPLGTVLANTLLAVPQSGELDVSNNQANANVTVVSSFDPNEKTARTSTGQSDQLFFIDQDEYLDYTIRFQNTGTSAAVNVVVTDTLDAALDMGSFQQGVASDPFTVSFRPGRVVQWTFSDINLPDSESSEAESQGLVSFRIRLAQPLLAGVLIRNAGNIYFDLNDPVRTNYAVITTETSTLVHANALGLLQVFPNPAQDRITVTSANERMRSVEIIGADGRTIVRRDAIDRSLVIDVADLASGIYLTNARLANGNELHTRFIKR